MLVVERVWKRFGEQPAVSDLSFEVRPGEIFGLLGPNGAGKTTTLRMIMGITAPDQGDVRMDGRAGVNRDRTGYLPEERGLFDDASIMETLGYLGALHGMRLADARAAALPWLARLGLQARSKEKVSALSKGNQQKIQFIGAVLHRPVLAILDEPFAGLDPLNQELFIDLMRDLRAQGTAVLLSAHHLDLVERLADRLLLISRGRAVLGGTMQEIRQQAAGGVEQVMTLEIGPHGGTPIDGPALAAELAAQVPGARAEALPGGDRVRVDIPLPAGADAGPVLRAVAARAAIRKVQSRALSLHEIYLDAVREGGAPAPDFGEVNHA
jgi:ABC-2 type transport system ATP-binding protein